MPKKSGNESYCWLEHGLAKCGKPVAQEWVPVSPHAGDRRTPFPGPGGGGAGWGGTDPWLRPAAPPAGPPPPRPRRPHSQRLGEGAEPLGHGRQPLPGAVHPTVAVAAAGRRAERRRRAAGPGRAEQPQGEEAEQPQRARHCCGRLPRRPLPRRRLLRCPPTPPFAPGQPACGLGQGSLPRRSARARPLQQSAAAAQGRGAPEFRPSRCSMDAQRQPRSSGGSGQQGRPGAAAGAALCHRTRLPVPGLPMQRLFKVAERSLQPCRPLAPAPAAALAQTPRLWLALSPPRINLFPSFSLLGLHALVPKPPAAGLCKSLRYMQNYPFSRSAIGPGRSRAH